jgi:hypothetical protein
VLTCAALAAGSLGTAPSDGASRPGSSTTGLRSKGPAPRTTFMGPGSSWSFFADTPALSDITVEYEGFTPEAEAAFERAVAEWERVLASPVEIRVRARFSSFGNPNILGGAGPNNAFKGEEGYWLPAALADARAGRDLAKGQPDIVAEFSSDYPDWHFGVEPAPRGASDFTSVVLHELTHGLGFTGSIIQDGGGTIAWGFGAQQSDPDKFDTLLADEAGRNVVATYPNGSAEFEDVLTGGALRWAGQAAVGTDEMFAPPSWQQGSSVYHYDEEAYPAGAEGSLMTPALYDGETIRVPDRLTVCLLGDLGWDVAAACGTRGPMPQPVPMPTEAPEPAVLDEPTEEPSASPSPLPSPEKKPKAPAERAPEPSPSPAPEMDRPFVDGDTRTTERVPYGAPEPSAVAISSERFVDDAAEHAVLSRDDEFPDSLAGAALTAEGPLLLTPPTGLDPAVGAELDRALPAGATVYLLGGEKALSPIVADAVAALGLVPQRLAGPSRAETSVEVAKEVRRLYGGTAAALARAYPAGSPSSGWADSVTGGAWAAATGTPILVTGTEGMHEAVGAWLSADAPGQTVLLGERGGAEPASRQR